jgi:microsomal epoxide hydrolase
VPDSTLADLKQRLARARWPAELGDGGWDYGMSLPWLRELADYWSSSFDWRAQERAMNGFAQFRARVDDKAVHFIHERGRGPDPLPLILTHGFPDSFLRFAKIIPMLTDPVAHGGEPGDSFDVVVPSLPGYGFSEALDGHNTIFRVGDCWHRLMTERLGYGRYAAHGGDWGSLITEILARDHGADLVGIHLTDVPFYHSFNKPRDATRKERKFLAEIAKFTQDQGGYAVVQGTTPQALGAGLNDSPVGLAAWIIEKMRRWSDCDGDVERRFTRDELLANVMIYWVTQTINTSFAPYFDVAHAGAVTWMKEKAKEWLGDSHVPAGFAMFPKDLTHPPRRWAERFFDVQRWTEMPEGGHFAALETPELLVNDIREFFRPLRAAGMRPDDAAAKALEDAAFTGFGAIAHS